MRRRREAVFASSESEYIKLLEEIDSHTNESHSRRHRIRITLDGEDEYNQLSSNGTYHQEERQQTISEQEKEDEDKLHYEIRKFNIDTRNSPGNVRTIPLSARNITSLDLPMIEKFLSQNIIDYDDKIKIILIGKELSGKTLLFNKLLKQTQFNNNKYYHTQSIDIRKTLVKIDNSNIRIEIIDTNEKIINGKMIKTYYQISDACIIITREYAKDIKYIDDQIESIREFSAYEEPNIFIVNNVNSNSINRVDARCKEKEIHFNRGGVNRINIDLGGVDDIYYNEGFKQFIRCVLNKKSLGYKN